MVRGEFLTFTVLVVLMVVSVQKAMALHCWHCNSAAQEYCGDPFHVHELTPAQRDGNYAACPKGDFGSPVCVKMISTINDKPFIRRICAATMTAANETCRVNGAHNVCEKCETDGCNAGWRLNGPIAILSVLPIAIIKFLSF